MWGVEKAVVSPATLAVEMMLPEPWRCMTAAPYFMPRNTPRSSTAMVLS